MKIRLMHKVVLAFLLASCSQQEAATGGADNTEVALAIATSALQTETTDTRVAATPLTTTGTVVRLYILDKGGSGYISQYNVPYTYTGGKWTTPNLFWVDARPVNVSAYYDPNGASALGESSLTNLSVCDYADNKIWYYDNSHSGINNTNAALSLLLECAWSRLSLKLSRATSYPTNLDCKVSRIKIRPSLGKFYTSAIIDITDGALSGNKTSDYTIDTSGKTMGTTGLSTSAADTSIDLLFPPQALDAGAGLTFTLTVDGVDYSATVAAAQFNEFKRGVRHTAHLEMTAEQLLIPEIYTENWTDGGTHDGEAALAPEKAIDLGLPFVIAPGNLIARDGKYKFTAEQGYYSNEANGGDYFDWGEIDPLIYKTDGSNSSATWNDPCALVRGGGIWHTPSISEWQQILGTDNVSGTWTMKDGGTNINGRYYGTTSQPDKSQQNNYVFLPYAGNRYMGGVYYAVNSGYYWTSEPNNSNNTQAMVIYVHMSNPPASGQPKSYGNTIRCIKNK